ncbi:YceD family protein [Erythrobacter sp. MTPC3]|uniref:YceD family protein n=1 Tax=Erythrobacter sp. MTPC3 TaxID=3056564 RepID=UPI0036F3B95B
MDGELTRLVKARPLPAEPVVIEADEAERAALAKRFGLASVASLRAEIALEDKAQAVRASGLVTAQLMQTCAVSSEDFPVTISEPLDLRFVPENPAHYAEGTEFEIEADDCDEIEYAGDMFNLGEAVAQTLGLAIDPYAEGPNADAARKAAGIVEEGQQSGPLADALAALKKD